MAKDPDSVWPEMASLLIMLISFWLVPIGEGIDFPLLVQAACGVYTVATVVLSCRVKQRLKNNVAFLLTLLLCEAVLLLDAVISRAVLP